MNTNYNNHNTRNNTTRRHARRQSNFSSMIAATLVVAIIVALWVAVSAWMGREQYSAQLKGDVTVSWSKLNVRQEAGLDAEIIGVTHRGETLVCTGTFRNWCPGDAKLDSLWYEVLWTDATTGTQHTGWVDGAGLR